ncbi:MAG: LysR family transcriptional regulator [Acidobacteria bacterium]|nr:MAG: LysR family transcriptional regulator [Acidobacteriota bacterium]PYY06204.1 MAG: LysR family transcriptional regulator [Acidobacteriota bacterium]
MQLHQLRYFCAVANAGSFTRAAEREHVAQPSLSQQVRKLEDELGARLFDRLGRRVRLTSFGHTFLLRAEAILREVSIAKREIEEMSAMERGRIVVGAIPTVAPYFLPQRLASFAAEFPGVHVSVLEDTTPVLLERLQEAAIDMALMALPVPRDQFVCQELLREPLYLVVPRGHRLAGSSKVRLKQVENDSFLLLKEGHCFRENTLSACSRAKVQPNVVFESGQFATILAMVAANTGVSVVPEMALEKRDGCCFIPIADEGAYRRVGVVQLKQHFRSRSQRAFLRHLQQTTRDQEGHLEIA